MWQSLLCSAAVSCLLGAQFDPAAKESEQEAKLARKVSIDKEMSAPLVTVLRALSDRFDVTFVLDWKAFEEKGHKEVMKAQVKAPAQKDVELRRVLLEMLRPVDGTCRAGKGYVEVVPAAARQIR
jgi:hypothetical protein